MSRTLALPPIARKSGFSRPLATLVALAAISLAASAYDAHAKPRVQQVTSPGGIKAWLMEDHSVPLITLTYAFRGGASQDLPGKEGTSGLLVQTIDEGAGSLSMTDFQRLIARLGIKVGISSNRDYVSGSLMTIAENRDKAAEILASMLTEPRFEQSSIDRVRASTLTSLAQRKLSPGGRAGDRLREISYPGHRYGRPAVGTEESLKTITRADIEDYRRRVFARDTLLVSVAGAIDASELGRLLDRTFGALPAKAALTEVPHMPPRGAGQIEVVDIDVPQSVALFQVPGLPIAHPDYMAARIMTTIIGDGGFESRLMKEIRVKRGLAYGVSAGLDNDLATEVWYGSVSSRNEAIGEALELVRAEMRRMAADGPTEEELAETKSKMIGLFAMNFDTTSSMASLMLSAQLSKLGIAYFENRAAMIERVTVADVKRIAQHLLKADDLLIVVAGRPAGITNRATR